MDMRQRHLMCFVLRMDDDTCIRMVNPDLDGLEGKWGKEDGMSQDDQLKVPTDSRLYAVQVTKIFNLQSVSLAHPPCPTQL